MSSDDDIEVIAMMVVDGTLPRAGEGEINHTESVCVHTPKKERNFRAADLRFDQFYDCKNPFNKEENYKRHFRMLQFNFDHVK